MNNGLYQAILYRAKKDRLTCLFLAGSLIYGIVYAIICQINEGVGGGEFLIGIFLMLAVYISLTIGGELSDGTMRNKITVGFSKRSVLLAEVVCGILFGAALLLCFLLPFTMLIVIRKDLFVNMSAGLFTGTVLRLLLSIVLYTMIYSIVSALTANKAAAAIVCLFLTAGLFFIAYWTEFYLGQVEIIGLEMQTNTGEWIVQEIPNPQYIDGFLRTIVRAVHDCDPQGQADGSLLYMRLVSGGEMIRDGIFDFSDVTNIRVYPIYAACGSCLLLLLALKLFTKKDLK